MKTATGASALLAGIAALWLGVSLIAAPWIGYGMALDAASICGGLTIIATALGLGRQRTIEIEIPEEACPWSLN